MTTCERCGDPLKKKWAVRLAGTNELNTTGPLYFCDEDCREQYRQLNSDSGLQPASNAEKDGSEVEYGDSNE